MDQEINDKDLFDDDTIEEELSKLEAEFKETSNLEDNDMVTIDHNGIAEQTGKAVELDKADFLFEEKEQEKQKIEESEPGHIDTDRDAEQPIFPITYWYLNKNIIGVGIISLVIVIAFAIYSLTGKSEAPDEMEHKDAAVNLTVGRKTSPPPKKAPLPDSPLALSPFIIPLDKRTDSAYLFLSISVMSPNSMVYEEIKRKKAFVRGYLYVLLRQMANGGKVNIVAGEELKKKLIEAVNRLLKSGKVEEIYFTEFFLV